MKKTPLITRRLFAGIIVLVFALSRTEAGTFSTDFSGGAPGVNLFGVAKFEADATGGTNTTDVLKLTEAGVGGVNGGAILDDFDSGATVNGFEVNFSLHIGRGSGADGMSFFFGDFNDAAQSEEGPGTINGLTVSFDVFNNGGTPAEAPAIDVKWNNVILVHRLIGADSATTGASPIGALTTIRTQPNNNLALPSIYMPVKIRVETDGRFSLAFNNSIVYTNLPIFRPITNITINASGLPPRFGFGARTGGSHDDHWIDNLQITTVTTPAVGQPYARSIQQLTLASATAGGFASAVAGAVVEFQEQEFTVNTNAAITMLYNNAAVTPTISQNSGVTRIAYLGPGGLLPVNRGTVVLTYSTTSTPPLTNSFTYSFVVAPVVTLPGGYPVASVDTSKPGFRVRVSQLAINKNPGTGVAANAERQLANDYVDPSTGLPYDNLADLSTTNEPGYFVIPGVWNVNGGDGGGVGNFANDDPISNVGIGANGTDHYVVAIETILELKAGPYRFGVNSDDGFRLAIGRGPGDVAGVQLGAANVDRGAVDTIMDVVIPADGFYPMRLVWWETGGGSSCEFFVQDIATSAKTLINDLTAASPVKAYRESAVSPPYISRALPTVDYRSAFADQDVIIDVTEGALPLSGTPILRINNVDQTITTGKTNNVTTIRRASSFTNLLPSGPNNVILIYSYTSGGSTVSLTNTWAYTVPAYTRPIPPGNKVLATDVSGNGFHERAARQIDRSGDANQGNGGRHTGNNMPGPEIELADGYTNPTNNLPFANLAGTAGANPDGSYDVAEVLNFNQAASAGGPAANAGIFNADTQLPGLPGTGTSNFGLDNSVHEFITYLELKAGVHIFGLNVDDGWICTSAPNPRDTLGTLLGFRNAPGGQNGSPVNNPNAAFTVLVPEDGVYPFRILFWEGGGGVNLEFLEVDRQTGTQILVNDLNGSYPSVVGASGQTLSAITAHNTYTGPVRPWVKFSVYPMPYIGVTSPLVNGGAAVTLWQNRNPQTGPGPINVKQPFLNANWNSTEIQAGTAQRPFGDAVGAIMADLGTGTVGMVLDGVSVTPTVTDIPSSTDKLVLYTPNPPLSSSSNHIAGLVYAGTTNYWLFNVIALTNVSAADMLPSSLADTNAVGFHVKVFQATNAQPNTAARAELQIAGLTNNVAIVGTNADGSYTVPGFINWNVQKNPGNTTGEIGNFQPIMGGSPDDPVPGIPGTGLTGTARFENIAAEIFAYLDLPAGYQKFGVNGDDGWKVQVGTPGQTTGTVLFTIDRGAGALDIPFAFTTPQAGLVPVRLVWYQGGGGGNLEFFTYGTNGTKIPINDRNNPNSVKAYYNVPAAPAILVTSPTNNTVYPGAPANVTITADATVQNSTITLVEFFYRGNIKIGEATAFPYSVVWNNAAFGPYLVTAKATAANGRSTVSAPVKFFVGTPVISNVVETGGDNEATDTVPAKWTGVTYVGGVLNEPITGLPAGASYMVDVFQEDAPAYVDRNHQWNGATAALPLPSYLVGNEYIMSGNDNRDNTNYSLAITLSQEADVYLLVDNRLQDGNAADPPTFTATNMFWLLNNGWTPVTNGLNRTANSASPDEVGVDEGGDGVGPGVAINNWSSVYVKRIPAGTFSIFQADNPGQNMYGVVIARIPVAGLEFTSATLGGGTATFTWTGTAILQQATALTGSPTDWSDVNPQPGGNTYQVQVSSAAQTFYRLKQ